MKCSAKDCDNEGVEDCGFFVQPEIPYTGIMFCFCKLHADYYAHLVGMCDGMITRSAIYGHLSRTIAKLKPE